MWAGGKESDRNCIWVVSGRECEEDRVREGRRRTMERGRRRERERENNNIIMAFVYVYSDSKIFIPVVGVVPLDSSSPDPEVAECAKGAASRSFTYTVIPPLLRVKCGSVSSQFSR